MIEKDDLQVVRTLKGAPASLLLALMITGRSMTKGELSMVTGYSDKPVSAAITILLMQGFIQDNGRSNGYTLTHGRLSLDLPTRNISDITTTTTYYNKEETGCSSSKSWPTRNISDFAGGPGYWLQRAGIGPSSKKMDQLLKIGMDEEYVKAHVLEYEHGREAGHKVSTGLLIRRLQDGDPAPEMRCERCKEEEKYCYCGRVKE